MGDTTNWSVGYNPDRKKYFDEEDYIDLEFGYPERPVGVFEKTLMPDFLSTVLSLKPDRLVDNNLFDVGCASGYYTRLLCKNFNKTVGVDFCETRIEYAKKYELDSLKFIQADLTSDLFKDKFQYKFDVFFTNAVIPHIPLENKVKVFDNLAEIANDNSVLVMYDDLAPTGVVDGFIGWISVDWLIENVLTWDYVSDEEISNDNYRIVLKKSEG